MPYVPSLHPSFRARPVLAALLLGVVATLGACGATERAFIGPAPSPIGAPPTGLGARAVVFRSGSGSDIHGWFVPGQSGGGAVVLLHGVHANRLVMLDRARWFAARGYAVLLPDFRAHGESPGDRITFGALESLDALAAVQTVKRLAPDEKVGVIGVSMGGAAALLAPEPLPVDALVLESVYPTIGEAVDARMRTWLWKAGPLVEPFFVHWLGPKLGVPLTALRPIDRIGGVRAPVFVIAGSADHYTPLAQSEALFARAPEPKRFWAVPGAGHVDLYAWARAEYERRVGGFLADYLRAPGFRPAEAMPSSERTGGASSASSHSAIVRPNEATVSARS